nr:diacylglycerol kinase [Desulforhopalus singaporensis]
MKRIIRAGRFSMQGLQAAFCNEAAFRQELGLFVLFVPLGIWLGETVEQRLLLIGSCFLVLIVELLNSAVEAVVDRIGTEQHELSGRAKDIGSAAVFCALVLVAICYCAIAWKRFMP